MNIIKRTTGLHYAEHLRAIAETQPVNPRVADLPNEPFLIHGQPDRGTQHATLHTFTGATGGNTWMNH